MPRFFFHVTSNMRSDPDSVGTDLPDLKAARSEAIKACGEMLRDLDGSLVHQGEWSMELVDEEGHRLLTFRFTEI